MKTKMLFLGFLICNLTINLQAQIVNVNPDPNGEPWWVGDLIFPSPEIIESVGFMQLTYESNQTMLPDIVDNAALEYMPPVFQQLGQSCEQAAEIGYSFTYEINRVRGVEAGDWEGEDKSDLYHHLYTYNFLNGGDFGEPTTFYTGYIFVYENGCPSFDVYHDPLFEYDPNNLLSRYWMHGYAKYDNAIHNKIDYYENIEWGNSLESLIDLKHWIADHNAAEETGGLAVIGVNMYGLQTGTFNTGDPEENKHYITQWGESGAL